jgi:hypothetical protein
MDTRDANSRGTVPVTEVLDAQPGLEPREGITIMATLAVDEANQKFDFGAVITREWLENTFGIVTPATMTRDEHTRLMLDFLSGWEVFSRGLLVNHKKALRSIGHGKWEIIIPSEQAAFALEETDKKIKRALRTGKRVISNTRTDLLTDTQRAAHRDAEGRMAALAALNSRKLPGK